MNQQRERVQREMVDIRNLGMILFQNHVSADITEIQGRTDSLN